MPNAVVLLPAAHHLKTATWTQGPVKVLRQIDAVDSEQIKPGATQEDVFQKFGEPTTKTKRNDTWVWNYHYTEATTKKGVVLFLIASKSETEHEGTVSVEFDKDMRVSNIARR